MLSVDLNNPKYIADAKKTQYQELEPLFWVVEDSLHKGDLHKAKNFYNVFLYIAKYNKDILPLGLKPKYIERLKSLAFELHGQVYFKQQKSIVIAKSVPEKPIPISTELELSKILCDNIEILREALGDRVRIYDTEVLVESDFRCDIVSIGSEICYPIELKVKQGNHAIVSQIEKYKYYFYRKWRYGLYLDIQGVVICNGFCDWSINELRRNDVWCFDFYFEKEQLKLRRVP